MRPMVQAMMRLNLDRDRILIDAGKGACAYALRLASLLTEPVPGADPGATRWDLGKTRLESLTGCVLIIAKKDPRAPSARRPTRSPAS